MPPSSTRTTSSLAPSPGLLATVRNRRALVTSVQPYDSGPEGRFHLVHLEYLDPDGPRDDQLLWEREPAASLLEPTALPPVAPDAPMLLREFDALVRATRWGALSPWVDPDATGPLDRLPLSAPVHGAIQVEDFQLVPLWVALQMPRVSLLLADDVGLGKTIEAGLILTELLLRRRVRRILIVCPASLRTQWQGEMKSKFALGFDIVDRESTHALQKRLGLDANPWRTYHRIITSYDYLKQDDVLGQFEAPWLQQMQRGGPDAAQLPWDLLVIDEAHNLAPATFGDDSKVCKMLRRLSMLFEHRLFLTATPHNGHTRSFTGLLELLDPVRFTRKSEPLTTDEKRRVEQVVIRRLKSEINRMSSPPRFADRTLEACKVNLTPAELALSHAFQAFRAKVRSLVAKRERGEQLAGSFAVEVLGKRLLSCPVAFADSWHRYQQGVQGGDEATAGEVTAAARAADEDLADDREAESRTAHAALTVGAWLKPLAPKLQQESAQIDAALTKLGLDAAHYDGPTTTPKADSRYAALQALLNGKLLIQAPGKPTHFRDDERLVIFTEYKTTLDYLQHRLRQDYPAEAAIRVLFGQGAGDNDRDAVIRAFNDPHDPVRVLVSTDAAAEGLNLQESARYVLHWDVPWNPSRLEQRNGRLDRHGQARDVTVHHFDSDDEDDLRFLAYVVGKVHTIREDLGSFGEVFDRAVARRLIEGHDTDAVIGDLDHGLGFAKGRAEVPRTVARAQDATREMARLEALKLEIDLDPDALRETLAVALNPDTDSVALEGPDARGRFLLRLPQIEPQWRELIDDELRLDRGATRSALPGLLFDPTLLLKSVGPRKVFRPDPDSVLLHLGHPMFERALTQFARYRFDTGGTDHHATRWTVRHGDVPAGADALLLLTVEELAVNELRETFHHWVRTVRIPIHKGSLGTLLKHAPAAELRIPPGPPAGAAEVQRAQELWDEIEPEVKQLVGDLATRLTESLQQLLQTAGADALQAEQARYQRRHGEISDLIAGQTVDRMQRELEKAEQEARQGHLFDAEHQAAERQRNIEELKEEIARRQRHYEELREQLARERDRVLRHLLPKRFTLRDSARVFPVAVEIRLHPTASKASR